MCVSLEKRYIRYMGNSPGQSTATEKGFRYIRYKRYRNVNRTQVGVPIVAMTLDSFLALLKEAAS